MKPACLLALLSAWIATVGLGAEVTAKLTSNQLIEITASNGGEESEEVTIPAGTSWSEADGVRFIGLRACTASLPAHRSASWSVPAATLMNQGAWKADTILHRAEGTEPKLEPLLAYLAPRDDVPRRTSQLVILALLQDVDYATWRQSPADGATPPGSRASDVAVALDALTILHSVAPGRDFVLARDSSLKLQALHDPALRARALQLYGLTITGEPIAGGVAPDLGQLLHTKPGDNCPICRLRQQMQPREDAP